MHRMYEARCSSVFSCSSVLVGIERLSVRSVQKAQHSTLDYNKATVTRARIEIVGKVQAHESSRRATLGLSN